MRESLSAEFALELGIRDIGGFTWPILDVSYLISNIFDKASVSDNVKEVNSSLVVIIYL